MWELSISRCLRPGVLISGWGIWPVIRLSHRIKLQNEYIIRISIGILGLFIMRYKIQVDLDKTLKQLVHRDEKLGFPVILSERWTMDVGEMVFLGKIGVKIVPCRAFYNIHKLIKLFQGHNYYLWGWWEGLCTGLKSICYWLKVRSPRDIFKWL